MVNDEGTVGMKEAPASVNGFYMKSR
ncbi:uncharacterized protein METZ01_LOCUS308090 [marine metagenome]|uniref:Uncharacterized protein n=1 Tax=marine metagenome TaxID=408172 RepID=A0A382N2D5_9ZZZZ